MGERQSNQSFMKRIIGRYFCHGSIDIWFLISVLMLVCVGLVMMFSASYPYAHTMYNNSTYFIKRQLLFACIGIVVMTVFSCIKTEFFKKLTPIVIVINFFLLLVVFVLPQYREGFYRWINLGFTTFQPSEIAKFAVVLVGAFIYAKYAKKMSSIRPAKNGIAASVNRKLGMNLVRESWIPTWLFCGFFGLTGILVYLENHLSGFILICAIGVVMMFIGGVKGKWFVAGICGILALLLIVCVPIMVDIRENDKLEAQGIEVSDEQEAQEGSGILKGYMRERIVAWLDKDFEPRGARWQTNQAVYAIGSGGFFGKGLGNSTQKYMYVSEPQNDMIFSIVCEELGFVGAALVLALFALLVFRGVIIGLNAKNRFGGLLAIGLVFQVGLQVVLNVCVATDTIPNTGISLPFFSYGGTSLVMLLAEMGIVLSVSKESKLSKK